MYMSAIKAIIKNLKVVNNNVLYAVVYYHKCDVIVLHKK